MQAQRLWLLFKTAGEAYGIWQLLAVLGITTVTSGLVIALVAQSRNNLNWFGQASLVVGVLFLSLVVVRLIAPAIIRRFSPTTGHSDTHAPDGLAARITALEQTVRNGQFDINILTGRHSPRFSVIAGPVSNPSHRYSDGDFSLSQYRAYLGSPPYLVMNTQIIMQLSVAIHVIPKMLVEQMELELMDTMYPCINWKSEYMLTDYVRDLDFVIPDSVTPGIHAVKVIARVNGEPRDSTIENVNFPER